MSYYYYKQSQIRHLKYDTFNCPNPKRTLLTVQTIYLPFVNTCLEQQIFIWFILKRFCNRFINFTIGSDSIINIFYWVCAFLDIINRSFIFIYRWVPTKFSPDLSPNFVDAGPPVLLRQEKTTKKHTSYFNNTRNKMRQVHLAVLSWQASLCNTASWLCFM